jgi:hypothetical protein
MKRLPSSFWRHTTPKFPITPHHTTSHAAVLCWLLFRPYHNTKPASVTLTLNTNPGLIRKPHLCCPSSHHWCRTSL